MYFEKDWMMRQIGQVVEFVARLFFHRDKIEYEVIDENNLSETDLVYRRLVELLSQNEICDAEDYLFERYKAGDGAYLTLALDFYQRLNAMVAGSENNDGSKATATNTGTIIVHNAGYGMDFTRIKDVTIWQSS